MQTRGRTACAAGALAFALGFTGASATAVRTFVSGKGSDSNACSLAAPCRTFAGALAQTSAGGEIVVLDSAGYGTATITQPVTISNQTGVEGAIGVNNADGLTISLTGPGFVTLKGLTFDGGGSATSIGVNIVHSSIGTYLNVIDCTFRNLAFGIDFPYVNGGSEGDNSSLFVLNSVFIGNHLGGLALSTSALSPNNGLFAKIQHSFISQNLIGIQAGGNGLLDLRITDVDIGENDTRGISLSGAFVAAIERSTVEQNGGNDVLINSGATGNVFIWNHSIVSYVNTPAGHAFSDGSNIISVVPNGLGTIAPK